jgi:hypothetical protein
MRNTLLRSLTLKVRGLGICLPVTLVFTASALGQTGQMRQTQVATSAAPAADAEESGSVVAASDAKEKPAEAQRQSGKDDDLKHWALSIHAGLSIPHGNLNNVFNPGPNLAFDVEYRINRTVSVEGIYGYHRFNGERFGAFTVADLNLHQFSINGKVYGSSSATRPFFNFGGGAYVFTPGASVHGGLNFGAGVQHDVTPNFAVEGVYNFHNVFTSGSNTQFSALQGGVRFRF